MHTRRHCRHAERQLLPPRHLRCQPALPRESRGVVRSSLAACPPLRGREMPSCCTAATPSPRGAVAASLPSLESRGSRGRGATAVMRRAAPSSRGRAASLPSLESRAGSRDAVMISGSTLLQRFRWLTALLRESCGVAHSQSAVEGRALRVNHPSDASFPQTLPLVVFLDRRHDGHHPLHLRASFRDT